MGMRPSSGCVWGSTYFPPHGGQYMHHVCPEEAAQPGLIPPCLAACTQGGKCAVFTLQRLGFEVDPVHSVQFSNHTGECD